jgi:hypothetical protein
MCHLGHKLTFGNDLLFQRIRFCIEARLLQYEAIYELGNSANACECRWLECI